MNCGATNTDNTLHCQKCGAILPLSSESPELSISLGSEDDLEEIPEPEEDLNTESEEQVGQEASSPSGNGGNEQSKMYGTQSIFMASSDDSKPQEGATKRPPEQSSDIQNPQGSSNPSQSPVDPQASQDTATNNSSGEWDHLIEQDYDEGGDNKEFLEEIEPTPFDNSLFNTESKSSVPPSLQPIPESNPSQSSGSETVVSPEKQERLESDMKDVLSFLSEKIPSVSKSSQKSDSPDVIKQKKKAEQNLKPDTINDTLRQLLKIDRQIEASAIIKSDGKMLASAISDRISDPLFATIGQNLCMISADILNGLNAGLLHSISLRGTEGVLDLAPISQDDPILKDLILIIFSNPSVKSGIIQIAIRKIAKQLKEFI